MLSDTLHYPFTTKSSDLLWKQIDSKDLGNSAANKLLSFVAENIVICFIERLDSFYDIWVQIKVSINIEFYLTFQSGCVVLLKTTNNESI